MKRRAAKRREEKVRAARAAALLTGDTKKVIEAGAVLRFLERRKRQTNQPGKEQSGGTSGQTKGGNRGGPTHG